MTIHVNKNEIYLDANDFDSMKQLHSLALSLSASRGWSVFHADPNYKPPAPPKPPAPSETECVVL